MQYKPDRIALRRAVLGLSQTQLAEKIKVSHQQMSKYERGLTMPSAATLVALADALECSADYLLGRVQQPEIGGDFSVVEKNLVLQFRAKSEELSASLLDKELAKIADPTRDLIGRLVKFFLKNPGQVDDITHDL